MTAPRPRYRVWFALFVGMGLVILFGIMTMNQGHDLDAENDRLARQAFAQRGHAETPPTLGPGQVDMEEVVRDYWRGRFLLVDARPVADWKIRHIPSALDRDRLNQISTTAKFQSLPVIVYGATAGDPASAVVAENLKALGVASVRVCTGGIDLWVARHHNTEQAP